MFACNTVVEIGFPVVETAASIVVGNKIYLFTYFVVFTFFSRGKRFSSVFLRVIYLFRNFKILRRDEVVVVVIYNNSQKQMTVLVEIYRESRMKLNFFSPEGKDVFSKKARFIKLLRKFSSFIFSHIYPYLLFYFYRLSSWHSDAIVEIIRRVRIHHHDEITF